MISHTCDAFEPPRTKRRRRRKKKKKKLSMTTGSSQYHYHHQQHHNLPSYASHPTHEDHSPESQQHLMAADMRTHCSLEIEKTPLQYMEQIWYPSAPKHPHPSISQTISLPCTIH